MVWYGMVLYGMVWYGMPTNHTARRLDLCGTISPYRNQTFVMNDIRILIYTDAIRQEGGEPVLDEK